ncbi:MAG: metallopeptidase family protein [Acidimicrobiales bacterium]|nr:metallopeptidase family protein [Acidimicrobiales bacterium]
MVEMEARRFEELVAAALDELPDPLADALDNVMVRIRTGRASGGVLGKYEGIPLTERDDYGGWGQAPMPDQVTIYRLPICAICTTDDEVIDQVRITVIHELAHHFGIDDHRLDELGWA